MLAFFWTDFQQHPSVFTHGVIHACTCAYVCSLTHCCDHATTVLVDMPGTCQTYCATRNINIPAQERHPPDPQALPFLTKEAPRSLALGFRQASTSRCRQGSSSMSVAFQAAREQALHPFRHPKHTLSVVFFFLFFLLGWIFRVSFSPAISSTVCAG